MFKILGLYIDFFDTAVFGVLEGFFSQITLTSQDFVTIRQAVWLQLSIFFVFLPFALGDSLKLIEKISKMPRHGSIKVLLIDSKFRESVCNLALQSNMYYYSLSTPLEKLCKLLDILRSTVQTRFLKYKDLSLDCFKRTISVNSRELALKNLEYELLSYLMLHAGRSVSKVELLEHVWGANYAMATRTVDVHISRLRQLLAKSLDKPIIHTVHCYGYILE